MMLSVRINTMELLKSTEIGANNGVYKMLFPKTSLLVKFLLILKFADK